MLQWEHSQKKCHWHLQLRSHDLGLCRSCDFSAQEYLMYSQKMHGTVKISCRFLIFGNLQNILNFPQLFLGYLRIENNSLFPVICFPFHMWYLTQKFGSGLKLSRLGTFMRAGQIWVEQEWYNMLSTLTFIYL